ncbi:MAG: hypothetical protein ABIQ18_38625 [Umezawaea sp.]
MTEATDPEAVRLAARDRIASTSGAWSAGEVAVTAFLRLVVADLHRTSAVVVEHAEFGHYGSGTASFVEVSFTSRDGSRRRGDEVTVLSLCLSRLAPFAALLTPTVRTATSHDLPHLDRAATPPVPGWERECAAVVQVLDRHDLALLQPRVLAQPISGDIRIDTFLADRPPYAVFDAWFHWND